MNLTIGTRSYNFAESADNNRVNVAERRMSDAAKEVSSKAKSLRHQAEEDALDVEGLLYGPGIAENYYFINKKTVLETLIAFFSEWCFQKRWTP